MNSQKELKGIFQAYSWAQMNVHVHTHLCDGRPDMTVENIAKEAEKAGVKLIVLTPHFHKQLQDSSMVLYENSDEMIFLTLRDEINEYEKRGGKVRFLLSSEVDIISVDGTLSMTPSKLVEGNLDFIMPTLNFHPALPLRAVDVTNPEGRNKMHGSGEYMEMVEKAGGMEKMIDAMYTAQANAIQNISLPAMLGHFFAAHSKNGQYNWFGLREEHLPMMKEGAEKVLEACKSTGTMIDITGNRIQGKDVDAKRQDLGFLFDFQKWFLGRCDELGIITCPGGDAHDLSRISGTWFYEELLQI